MLFFIVINVLSVVLALLSGLAYILRLREIKLNVIGHFRWLTLILKCIILPTSFILLPLLCVRTQFFRYSQENITASPYTFISTICIIRSIFILILSFQLTPKYEIELDYPSRSKSKKGMIKLGKIMSKSKTKHNFFLNITDLAQHMFVCGITGTGKSNLIQYFLLNFR